MSSGSDVGRSALGDGDQRRVLDQLGIWRKELINLAKSNRLLYFRHTRASTLEIVDGAEKLARVVRDLLAGRTWRFYLPPDPDPDPEDDEERDESGSDGLVVDSYGEIVARGDAALAARGPAQNELLTSKKTAGELRSTLRTLDRRATQEFMDKGIWVLYMAVGMLRWTDPDTAEKAESPLVLLPVQLHRESPREPFELRKADDDLVLNPALAVKLTEYGVELPGVDEEDLQFEATLDAIEQAVAEQRGWGVERRLVISPFSFHKEVMFRDLLRNEEAVAGHQLVQALAIGAQQGDGLDFDVVPEDRLDEEVKPEETATILDADATQMQCIAAAAGGRSFVMDGPPGTGKSQTIANMIAELLGKGRKVLFVSEKAAALEVVQKRLRTAGLGDYCLELHSHKATRKEVAQQLGRALDFHPEVPPGMADTLLAQLRQRRRELSERAAAMNVVREPLGSSLHDVVGRISQLQHLPQAPPPEQLGSWLSAANLAAILAASREIARAWGPVERGGDFVWRDLTSDVLDASRTQRTRLEIEAAVTRLTRLEGAAGDAAEALSRTAPADFKASEALARILRHLETRPPGVSAEWLSAADLGEVEALAQNRRHLVLEHQADEKVLLGTFGSRWRDLDGALATRCATAMGDAGSLEPRLPLPDSLSPGEVARLLHVVTVTRELASSVRRDAERLAATFGLPATRTSLRRAADLAKLALLAGESVRPEPAWINPAVIAGVEEAARTLGGLCSSFNERRGELGSLFTDDVLALDLESLCQRFKNVHRGFGKLRGAYRRDKQAVAAVARSGKASKDVVERLPEALDWQRLTAELRKAEARQADLLGSHYYQSTQTDFDAIGRALEGARRAIEVAGEYLNVEAMRRQIGRGGTPDPDVLPVAARLRASIESWSSTAEPFSPLATALTTTDLASLSAWCEGALPPLTSLAEAIGTATSVAGHPVSLGELTTGLAARSGVDLAERTLADSDAVDRQALGVLYQALDTNWDAFDAAVDWTAELRKLVGGATTAGSAKRLASVELQWRDVDQALNEWHRARDQVLANFQESRAPELRSDLDTTFEDGRQLLDHLDGTISDIDVWVDFNTARSALAQLGVGGVIAFCESGRLPADQVAEVMERACLERWADTVIVEDRERLRHLRADQLDPMVTDFRGLDKELTKQARRTVTSACNAVRPRTAIGAAGIIKREAEKQRRHMPIRKLLEGTAEVAQALKPCFMMSPLTVSQFLPASLRFDAVIFDEASQVRPCDAINCIYRGKQLIVAGDDKQLPPTSFFEAGSVDRGDDWEEDQFEDFESIIKLGKGSGGLQELPLRWHYRSQHEDLIAYSNFAFYDGRLVTFPGSAAEADDLGVKLLHVPDGVYRRGTARDNPKEAERVVDRVLHWARYSLENPSRAVTLGVVAFSDAQAETIEFALDRRRHELPELDDFFSADRLDGFFVKNLENVQGDERDVMIFSVGYGRDEAGKFTMNFGPLNRDGGERRLNVAITRARRRVEIVSSITGTETEFSSVLKDGPRHLQRYLDFAARGPAALAIDVGDEGRDAESPLEEEVLRTVHSWGFKVKPQVGTAGYRVDLGVWHPAMAGRFALGIECDGRMYHSSRVARDRDRLRQEVLEHLGWRIHRIWGTSWYRYRSDEEKRLKAAIEAAIAADGEPVRDTAPTRPEPAAAPVERLTEVSLDGRRDWATPYQIATPTPPQYAIDMALPDALFDLRRMILEVVAVEGPIEDDLLLRRVREAWGAGRAGSRIRENFDYAIRALEQRNVVLRLRTPFTYVREEQLRVVRVPTDDKRTIRTVTQIAPTEYVVATKRIIDEAVRVQRDELTFEVAHLFGWNRRGPDIAVALDDAVDYLLRNRIVTEEDGFLRPS